MPPRCYPDHSSVDLAYSMILCALFAHLVHPRGCVFRSRGRTVRTLRSRNSARLLSSGRSCRRTITEAPSWSNLRGALHNTVPRPHRPLIGSFSSGLRRVNQITGSTQFNGFTSHSAFLIYDLDQGRIRTILREEPESVCSDMSLDQFHRHPRRPRGSATAAVVLEPAKGSNTMSPSSVRSLQKNLGSADGNRPG
jgi:hypothetical protein